MKDSFYARFGISIVRADCKGQAREPVACTLLFGARLDFSIMEWATVPIEQATC
jgi:hypothetical protein